VFGSLALWGCGSYLVVPPCPLAPTLPCFQELNPIPFPLIFANCCGWVAYSLLIQDAYLFVPNAVGLMLGLYMTASCFPFASPKVCAARPIADLLRAQHDSSARCRCGT
jgi:hypothetical protein